MVTPAQARFEVAEYGIDPLELGNSLGLRPAATVRSWVDPASQPSQGRTSVTN